MGDCGLMTWAPAELAMKIAAPSIKDVPQRAPGLRGRIECGWKWGLKHAATTLALTQTGLLMEVIVSEGRHVSPTWLWCFSWATERLPGGAVGKRWQLE